MITWIYLFGVLVTFISCIIKITANDMWREFEDTSGKCAVIFMSACSWLGFGWLLLNEEYDFWK